MPHIEKLVIKGFKSFASEIEIPFSSAMNVIVGPNGSGKSNIADALCFVLGRLSIKSMRAAKAANLIFAGTKTKKPLSEAYVKIVFDNSDKGFNIDSKKVEIQRIVRKNGQGIYKINNETKTRNEVIELLAHAGIDPYGFNIVLQGEIMDLVKMNSEERRKVIEEVAGISVYEARKKRSLRELEKTEEKLKEINAVLREKFLYLKNLENERQQAIKFKKLEDNLARYKTTLLHRQIDGKQKEIKKIGQEIDRIEGLKEKLKNKIETVQGEIKKREEEINDINVYTQKSSGVEMEKLHREVADLRAEIAGLDVRKDNVIMRLDDVLRRRERAQKEIKDYEKEISELRKKSPMAAKKQKELEQKKAELEVAEGKRKKFYTLKTELNSLKARISDKKTQLQRIRNDSDFALNEIKKLSQNLVNKDVKSCRKKIDELNKLIADYKGGLESGEKEQIRLEKSISLCEQEIEKNKKIKEQIVKLDVCPLCKSKMTKDHLGEVIRDCNLKISKSSDNLQQNKENLEDARRKINSLRKKIEEFNKDNERNNIELVKLENINDKKDYIKRLVSEEKILEKELRRLEAERGKFETGFKNMGGIEEDYDRLLMEIEDISSRNLDNLDAEIRFRQRDLNQTRNIIKQTKRDEEGLLIEKEDLGNEIEEKSVELEQKREQEQELQKKFHRLFDKRTNLQKEVQEKTAYSINLNHELRELEDRINNLRVDKARVDAEHKNLEIEAEEFVGIEIISASISVAVLKQKIEKTQQILQTIGSVNMRALEMYDEIKKGYNEVAEKTEKLNEEKEEILKIIQEIDKKKKRTFMKTLDAVNQIFSRNFMQVSTKGYAFLDLENKIDPFSGGLNIIIRVARGKYFDVSSLSGGEKTLIALSLIFAIQEYKPYCFYVFDEVDAALDKRNSEKLAALIKKHMKTGQYIVVTHNDALITESTILYGVSMQDGLSKVLSLKI